MVDADRRHEILAVALAVARGRFVQVDAVEAFAAVVTAGGGRFRVKFAAIGADEGGVEDGEGHVEDDMR